MSTRSIATETTTAENSSGVGRLFEISLPKMEFDMDCPAMRKPARIPPSVKNSERLYETNLERLPVVSPELFQPNTNAKNSRRRKRRYYRCQLRVPLCDEDLEDIRSVFGIVRDVICQMKKISQFNYVEGFGVDFILVQMSDDGVVDLVGFRFLFFDLFCYRQ